jgi:fluoroquinolone resistance protein
VPRAGCGFQQRQLHEPDHHAQLVLQRLHQESNLRYANFSRITLECELWENRWDGANVSGASFAGSDLSGGQFEGIDWNSASFTDCDLTNSDLGELDLRSTSLRGATLDVQQVALLMQRIGIAVVP